VPFISLFFSLLFAQADAPRPEDYRVDSVFTGTPTTPKFATPAQRRFRTMIRDAAKKGPNFAGHYTVASWGCGSGCVQSAVVDAKSGDVYDLPFATVVRALCSDEELLAFKTNSSLLIATGCPNEKDCGVYYYNWTGAKFTLLRKDRIKEPCKH
jgi:hypothetical protein